MSDATVLTREEIEQMECQLADQGTNEMAINLLTLQKKFHAVKGELEKVKAEQYHLLEWMKDMKSHKKELQSRHDALVEAVKEYIDSVDAPRINHQSEEAAYMKLKLALAQGL